MNTKQVLAATLIGGAALVGLRVGGVIGGDPDPTVQDAASEPAAQPAPEAVAEAQPAPDPIPDPGAALAAADAERARLEEALATAEAEAARLAAELAARDEAAAGRDAELEGLKAEIARQSAEIARLTTELSTRDAEVARLVDAAKATGAGLPAAETLASDLAAPAAPGAPAALAVADGAVPPPAELVGLDPDASPERIAAIRAAQAIDRLLEMAKDGPLPRPAPTPAGQPIAQLHFEMGSAALTPGAERRARDVAALLATMPVDKIRVAGHSDTVGSARANLRLSEARARAVADLLVAAGLPADKIEVVALGEDEAALPIATAAGVAEPLNRSVGIYPVGATEI